MYKIPKIKTITLFFLMAFANTNHAQFYESSLVLENIQYGLNICQADFNKDGKLDFVSGGYAGEQLKIYFQQNNDRVYIGKPYNIEEIVEVQGLATGDFNADGNLDIIVGGRPLLCLYGDGRDNFIQKERLSEDYFTNLIVDDFDGNGAEDLAAIQDKKVLFFWNNGIGKFEESSVPIGNGFYNLKKIDLNKDAKIDLVFTCNEKNKEYIGYLENLGNRKFKTTTLAKTNATDMQMVDYDNDKNLDLIAINIDNRTLSFWQNNGDLVFENFQNVLVEGVNYSVFAKDVNADKKMDFVLVDYNGSIYFVLNKGNQNFVKTPMIAKIPNYLRRVDLLSKPNDNSLRLIHTGEPIQGVYEVFLPQTSTNLQKPFEVIHSKTTIKKIQAELAKYYNSDQINKEALVFAYNTEIKNIYYKDVYLITLEGDWFRFDTQGDLVSSAPVPSELRFSPYSNSTNYTEYPLEEVLEKENAYAAKIVQEFLNTFYTDVKFDLYTANYNSYSAFKGIFQSKEETHELYLSWQNYSDGLEWNFWTTDLFRTNSKDQFVIISNQESLAKIKTYINTRYSKRFCDEADVFRRTTRSFSTPQQIENIPFNPETISDTSYGIYIKGHLLSFDMEGNFLRRE